MRLLSRMRLPNDLVDRLEEQAAAAGPAGIRRRAVVLLRPYSWRWLLAIVRCYDITDDDTARFLDGELADWRARSARIGIAPPDDVAEEIRARLPVVDDGAARAIEFVLRTSVPRR